MKIIITFSGRLLLLLIILVVSKTAVATAVPPANDLQITGSTTYVAPNGSNSNPGTLAAPFATIQHAVDHAGPGDTVYVRSGTYVEDVVVRNSGTAANPITITAYPNEHPVIDGQYNLPEKPAYGWGGCNNSISPPKCFHYTGLVWLRGDHVIFEGFEIKRSLGRGMVVQVKDGRPTNVIIRNNIVHDHRSAAFAIIEADNILVEGNEFYHAGDYATPDRSGSNLSWPVAVSAIESTNIVYKSNVIHNNWGEGLSTGRGSVGVHVIDNTLYDNFALNIYIHRSHSVYVARNLVYCTNDPDFHRGGNPPPGITINNETNFSGMITVDGVRIVNNLVTGCRQNFAIWSQGTELTSNVIVTHNTFVNATSNPGMAEAIGVTFATGNYKNIQFMNNIISQSAFNLGWSAGSSGITYNNNLWSAPAHSSVAGAGDLVGNPAFVNGNGALQPGLVSAAWFKLQASSPAIDAGAFAGQLDDHFSNLRGLSPDIGMHEHPDGVIQLLEEKIFLPAAFSRN